MSAGIDETTPRWGTFPVEQYLIRHWDDTSSQSDVEQRQRLIRAFLSLDRIPQEWDGVRDPLTAADAAARDIRLPTDEEVTRILAPWRSSRLRSIAAAIWRQLSGEDVMWLRTYYANGKEGGERLRGWVDEDELFKHEEYSSRVLDDADSFDFAEDWQNMFDVLPELACEPQAYSRLLDGPEARVDVREAVARGRSTLRDEVRNATDKLSHVEISAAGIALQILACKRLLVIADKEAFETDKVLFVFMDAWGNMIRQLRLAPEDMSDVIIPFGQGMLSDTPWFIEEIYENTIMLGEKYKAAGEKGLQLYGVEDLLTP